jgi:transcriptional regulator with XRE-family HTH domain
MGSTADLIAQLRARSGLSQRALAQRAGTSAAAICQYESGQRTPRVDTLRRIVQAAGATLDLGITWPSRPEIDLARNARILEDVLGLADALPHRSTQELEQPPFASLAR